MERLRTRRQTRAAVLERLLATGGLFRPQLAADCHLTEASISRIVAELRDEGLVEEIRRPAPYHGGPSQMVSLRADQWVAGLDLANERLALGIASIAGEVAFHQRLPLPALSDCVAITGAFEAGIAALAAWFRERGAAPLRVAASIPGLREPAGAPNPIVALDSAWLTARLQSAFPGVPVALANSVAARAAMQLRGPGNPPVETRHLYVHLGHGVGGAWVEPVTAALPIRPIEFGHIVVDRNGPRCRCGHLGCLEAIASATAAAAICGIAEPALIAAGDDWPALVRMTPRRTALLRDALHGVGLVIGNVLNVMPVSLVVLSGWPAALPPDLQAAIGEGMDSSLFGGLAAASVPLRILPASLGTDPRPALAWAMHELVRDGGFAQAPQEAARRATR
ncbi:transcriptional regulator [Falsiroseomonas bella]|uniref:Transcriptional regulator n=1 Tax=Falsiroseomonas bella TaxID=2184016 RepID=A0A317FMU6_9PROT|nr:ROK family transcriptional regulator [Falsiroseomonas bella]PWS38956.1 transcriptional regulator [Falsiroseomonas bella]